MYKKTCPFCMGESFSASTGEWICPYCEADLTILMPEPAGRARRPGCEPEGGKVVFINKNRKNVGPVGDEPSKYMEKGLEFLVNGEKHPKTK